MLVHSDRFDRNAMTLKMRCNVVDVVDLEGQVSQAARLGIAEAPGWVREGEELDLCAIGNPQIQLEGVSLPPMDFRDDLQLQDLGVESLGSLIVRADDSDVMRSQGSHIQTPIKIEHPVTVLREVREVVL
jgi:hypothetical protein